MRRYFVTGATGYVGSMIMKTLIQTSEYKNGKIEISVLARNTLKFQEMFMGYDCSKINLIQGNVDDKEWMGRINGKIQYIIHCASPTNSAFLLHQPVETMDTVILGTRNVLEFARIHKIESMVYLSSMEVYGSVSDIGRTRTEEELGMIPQNSLRSSYPMSKLTAEYFCYLYAEEYGVPVKVARLAQTFGKGVLSNDSRVYMQFARAVKERRDIILKTDGCSRGNYCDIEDTINAILLILNVGLTGEVYNVVNEECTMRIKEMAEMVAEKVAKGTIRVKIQPEDTNITGFAVNTALAMSSEKLRKLGWKPLKNLEQMYYELLCECE